MDLNELRKEIDKIDQVIVEEFCKRMDVVKRIGIYKKENNLPVYDASREAQKLENVCAMADMNKQYYVNKLYKYIFELSREYEDVIKAEEK